MPLDIAPDRAAQQLVAQNAATILFIRKHLHQFVDLDAAWPAHVRHSIESQQQNALQLTKKSTKKISRKGKHGSQLNKVQFDN